MNTSNTFFTFILLLSTFNNIFVLSSIPSESQLWGAFQNWMTNYDKMYDSSELQSRFTTWKENCFKTYARNLAHRDFYVDVDIQVQVSSQENSFQSRSLNAIESELIVSLPKNTVPVESFNQFSDLSYYEFSSIYTGAEPTAEVLAAASVASTGLSTMALAGVIAGGVCGLTLVGATILVAVKLHNRNTELKQLQEQQKSEKLQKQLEQNYEIKVQPQIQMLPTPIVEQSTPQQQPQSIPTPPPPPPKTRPTKVRGGVDVFNMKPGSHQSITARSIPIILKYEEELKNSKENQSL
eukprot:gene1197-1510_t